MPETLSEITLRYSRDLSALDADCRAQRSRIDQTLRVSLQAVAGARPLLAAYDKTGMDAAAARDKAVSQADAARQDAEAQAETKRRGDLIDVQQKYVEADRAADDAKQAAAQLADRAYQAQLDDIDRLPLVQQQAERQKAFEKYQKALAAVSDAWKQTLLADRDKQQAGLSAALRAERRAGDQAADRQAAARQAADAVYQQALTLAQAALAAGLSGVPDAAAVQAEAARQADAAQQDCRTRAAALDGAFRQALEQLKG